MALNANAIVTWADMKQRLRLTKTEDKDVVENLINRVSSAVESFLQRKVVQQTITDERHDGTGLDSFLILNYAPIVSIASLYDDTVWDFGSDTLLTENDDFVVNKEAGIIHKAAGVFYAGSQNIKVTYDAGWTSSDIPMDIYLAAEYQVQLEYQRWKDMRIDRASERKGDGTITYQHTDLHPEVVRLLNPWVRRIAI